MSLNHELGATRLVQHWTRPRGPGTRAVGVVRCEACQAQHDALYPEGRDGHVVPLSTSQARGRRCLSCGAVDTREAIR